MRQRLAWAAIISLTAHGLFFIMSSKTTLKQPELPMASGIAMSLIAEKPVVPVAPAPPPTAVAAEAPVPVPVKQEFLEPAKTPIKQVEKKKEKKIAAKQPPKVTPQPKTTTKIQPQQVTKTGEDRPKAPANTTKKITKRIENPSLSQPGSQKSTKARPRYDQNPPPVYPRLARKRGIEGTVLLDVLVNPSGKVRKVRLAKSSGHAILDKSALRAVRKWLFHPGKLNGENIEMNVVIPVRFNLQETVR